MNYFLIESITMYQFFKWHFIPQVKDIEAEREMLIASNKSISEYNLSQKSVIEQCHENLDSSYQRAVELKNKLLAAKSAIGMTVLYIYYM